MFKNRAIRMEVVKTPKQPSDPDAPAADPTATAQKIIDMIKANSREVAVGFVAVYAAVRVIDASCEIAVNAAPKKH